MTFKHKLSKRLALSRSWMLAVVALGAIGCKGNPIGIDAAPPGTAILRISPRTASIAIRDSVTLSAYLVTESDSTLASVSWTSDGGNITGKGAGKGRFKADKGGRFSVRASYDSLADTVTVTVGEPSVATITLSPATSALAVGGSVLLVAQLRDSAGQSVTGRMVTWRSESPYVVAVDSSGWASGISEGTAVITATCDSSSGTAAVAVVPINSAEPVYDASNADHLLHAYEDWSNLTRIQDLPTTPRSDGGPPWTNAGIVTYGAVVDQGDPFGSRRYVTADFGVDPPNPPHGTGLHAAGYHWFGGGSPGNGFQGDFFDAQGDDNALGGNKNYRGFRLPANGYLNKPTRDAVVYEWAVRQRGTNWYQGKNLDINGGFGSGLGRFDVDPWGSRLGGQDTACSDDPVCSTYYDTNESPLFQGLPPTRNYVAPNLSRTQTTDLPGAYPVSPPKNTIFIKQNVGWGTGPGQFSWGSAQLFPVAEKNADLSGTGKAMWEAGWLYFKLQFTREPLTTPYVYGRGRIEMWVGKTPGSLLKIMEYLGGVGERDEGLVFIDPTGSSDLLPSAISYFALLARMYTGGAVVDIGTIRIWSHARQ